MDITEVARRSGVPASTLRFYEEKELIASIGRWGLHRVFDHGVLERLVLIALGRSAGRATWSVPPSGASYGPPRLELLGREEKRVSRRRRFKSAKRNH